MASVPATDPLSAIVRRLCAPLFRIVAAGVALAGSLPQAAAVGVDFVYVGDAGNAADTTGYGAVASAYAIGVFELTNAQYVEFLNAVDPDGTNPNSIYSPNMGSDARGGISFTSGNSAGSKYASRTNMADKPVGFVSWFDGARFTNWLQNGGSTYGTTSSGSAAINSGAYTLNGATSGTAPAVTAGSTYRIPNENEWYKAAYYKGSGTNAGYWTYATQSNTAPSLVGATTVGTGTAAGASPVTTGNYANYNYGADWNSLDGNLTSVGSNGGASAYGTFDMSGNTGEWNDYTGVASTSRAIRGASFYAPAANIASTYTSFYVGGATVEQDNVGLRLASVIPTSLTWSTSSGTWSSSSRNWSNGKGGIYAFAASGTATFSATAGGTITISGTIQPAAITVSATSGTYTFVSSAGNLITGTARLSKSGAATLVLSGSNSFTGGTTLTAGTLRVGHDGALGSGTMTLGGGTLASADNSARSLSNPTSITADTVVGDATGTGMLTLSGTINLGGSPRTLTTVADLTISGPMSNGSLTKAGIGTLTLSASNSFTGATTLMGGTLSLGHAGALGTSGTISFSGGTLQFTSSNTTDYSSRFATAAGQPYAIDTNGQNVTLATALTSSNASLSKSGGGTLNLTGNNTYTGTTTVLTGTLSIGSGGTTGAVAGNIVNSAAVRFNRSDALAYSGTISGTGALIKSGAGTLTLSGNNTYTGTTAVAAGKLLVNGALASSTTSISAAAVLGGSGTISGAVVVGNTGTLSPGNSPGILTVGSLSLSSSAFTLMEIVGSGSTAGVAGTAYDQVAITTANGVSFGGTLDLDLGNRTSLFAQGTTFQLFSFSGTTAGDFTTIRTIDSAGSYAGLTFIQSAYVAGEWTTGIIAGSGNQYLMFSENTGRLVALPEPSAVAMAALGAGLAGWRLVRRRASSKASA